MAPLLRSNGSSTKPPSGTRAPAVRPPVAGKVERAVDSALDGGSAAVLNVTAGELLAEPVAVADAIEQALGRPGVGLMGHWMVHELFRRSELYDALVNSLIDPNPLKRAAAARICGAVRVTESVLWISDLVRDPNPRVREAAVRALAQLGGRRAVEELVASAAILPLHRLAIALARAASDLDVEWLMRKPPSVQAAVATVLACGLRGDVLRIPALLGIAHDRRWPKQVRLAACKSLAMIGDPSAARGLNRLSEFDPDPEVRKASSRSYKRLIKRAVGQAG